MCGFTYIGLLMLLAVIAIAATASVQLGSVVQRRGAEQELLFLGGQFRAALTSYANASAPNQPRFPRTLEQLLRDPRVPGVRRHLRRVPVDPLTGNDEWGIVRSADGYIVGVHSLSQAAPIKRGNFAAEFADFGAAASYRNWVFRAAPQSAVAQRAPSGTPPPKK
ncbi:MAG: type II secretion system protein [Burkholderiaceae bacterium]